jgi:anaerobic ribonucleoside-triphosphate reductase activating protein
VRVALSRMHYPVTALGPGQRAGIWLQGCAIGCAGCLSRDTWDPDSGTPVEVGQVLDWLADQARQPGGVQGVTISGGEPTEQAPALHELAAGINEMRRNGTISGDILCYTGLDEPDFYATCPWSLELIDAVITGPFRITEPTDLLWRGSANQRLIALTDLGHHIYDPYLQARATDPPLQVAVADGQVWMIGIPRRGDLQRLESAVRSDGVQLKDVSWRPQ